ncbi:hypothetical protein SAMN05444161_8924 [Rhizobiales bacterium GAS191]|nr:hypothetical protein SAMN05444161_8924 [Rhizobiales bacterium GAS191]
MNVVDVTDMSPRAATLMPFFKDADLERHILDALRSRGVRLRRNA